MNLHTANNKFWETNNEFVEGGSGGGGTVTVDTALSESSTNPVQNKAIYAALQGVTVTVDSALSESSENPVQNKVVYAAIQDLNTAISGVDTLIGSGVIE